MRTQSAQAGGKIGVVGDHCTAVTDPAQVLRRIEAVGRREAVIVGVQRAVGLCRVLQNGEAKLDRKERGSTVEMHGNDDFGLVGYGGACGRKVEGAGVVIHIDHHRSGARGEHGRGGWHGGMRRHNHLIAGADTLGDQREL